MVVKDQLTKIMKRSTSWIWVAIFNITITAVLLELAVFSLYFSSPTVLFPGHIDHENIKCSEADMISCDHPRFHNQLGWNTFGEDPYGDGIRETSAPDKHRTSCVAAFGDSFTYSNDVDADHSWTSVLSDHLGCEVKNYGVGGYSYVQAFLKYELYQPMEETIIFLVYEEMLKRSLASSNFFLSNSNDGFSWPKPFIDTSMKLREIPNPLTNYSLQSHIFDDWYSKSPKLKFPYFLNWFDYTFMGGQLEANSYGYHSGKFNTFDMNSPRFPDFLGVFFDFVNRKADEIDKPIIIALLPSSTYLDRYSSVNKAIGNVELNSNICILNPAEVIVAKNQQEDNLLGATNHFNELGERLLALAIYEGLRGC